jgi:hypothetical protein
VDIYPTAAVGSNGTIVIRNNTQTVLATIPYTTTVTGGSAQTVLLNVPLTPGTGYEIGQGAGVNLNRNTSGAVYPYTNSSVSITGNTFDPVYYYFFYNWVVATGCESARVPVVATVTPSPALTISGSTIKECSNTIVPLSVSSTIADYDTYIWSPITNLYTDALATIPYTGTSETTVYIKSNVAGVNTVTLSASNTSTFCSNVATTSVNYLPGNLILFAYQELLH